MSLLYRAIFSDDRPALVKELRRLFGEWLEERDVDVAVPEQGSVRAGPWEVRAVEATEADVTALRLVLHEEGPADRSSTTLTVIEEGEGGSVWVDLERVREDAYGPPAGVEPPALVPAILANGSARAGPVPLGNGPTVVARGQVEGLAALLLDPSRPVPVVVMAKDRHASLARSRARGRLLAHPLAGVAPVFVLSSLAATDALGSLLGPELKVFAGGVRTYLPRLTVPDRHPRRHRVVRGDVVARDPRAVARRLQADLLRQAVTRRPPALYQERVVFLPGFPHHRAADPEEVFAGLLEVEQERDRLGATLEETQDQLDLTVLELDEALGQLEGAWARVRYLEARLAERGEHLMGHPLPPEAVPPTARSCAEALALATEHLPRLVIGDTLLPAAGLDDHTKGGVWARKAWRALRALDDYARIRAEGGGPPDFEIYCQSPPPGAWAVPALWVALSESDFVDTCSPHRAARTFPVPPEVRPRGQVYMCAHVRIELGGSPSPRLHFYDDTAGPTGKVYVGYLGPHLPSNRTN